MELGLWLRLRVRFGVGREGLGLGLWLGGMMERIWVKLGLGVRGGAAITSV